MIDIKSRQDALSTKHVLSSKILDVAYRDLLFIYEPCLLC